MKTSRTFRHLVLAMGVCALTAGTAGDAFVQITAGATLEFESNIGGLDVEGGKTRTVFFGSVDRS